jgi:uncharacterized protein YegJ (DUF2314 family)
MEEPRHPLLRRLSWNPLLVVIPFAYMAYRVYMGQTGVIDVIGLGVIGLWFGLSVYDLTTSHKWLDTLYGNKEPPSRLISFVALLREPANFDPAVLAKLAGKAWNADLGTGESEGADGFVAGVDPIKVVAHEGRMFLINSFPTPYSENREKVAAGIPDLRVRELFRQHRAWFSCDAMGVDATTPEEEVLVWYERLGKLFAELLDENCSLIFLPDSELAFPINEETESALRSKNPVTALQETLTVPIVQVSPDDPLMKQAVSKARESWPKFVEAYEARDGQHFTVKAPVTRAGNTEFIWIDVTSIEGDFVYGELGNEPANLGSLKLGSKVSVRVADLNDWCYIDSKGNLAGGFTVEAVQKASRRDRMP